MFITVENSYWYQFIMYIANLESELCLQKRFDLLISALHEITTTTTICIDLHFYDLYYNLYGNLYY